MNDEFMSVSEAAKQLGVSGRRIRQLIEDEELQARRIGNSWVISASEINQRKRRSPRPGRPYEQENVWKVAAFADGIAHAYVSHVAEDSSWSHALAEQQDHLASRLLNSLAEICEFNAHEVIDNPAGLAELRKLLSRAQSLSRRDELLAGWMHQVATACATSNQALKSIPSCCRGNGSLPLAQSRSRRSPMPGCCGVSVTC